MATDISSEFPELIGNPVWYRIDQLNNLCKLPRYNVIRTKYDTCIGLSRIIKIHDYSAIFKSCDDIHNQYMYTDEHLGNEISGVIQYCPRDIGKISNNYFVSSNRTYDTKTLSIHNDCSIGIIDNILPYTYMKCPLINYDPGNNIEIIKWYLLEDLTVNMYRISKNMDNVQYNNLQINNAIDNIFISNNGKVYHYFAELYSSRIDLLVIKIYGFNSELLKEIDRFSWMRRRSAIIRPDEFDYDNTY